MTCGRVRQEDGTWAEPDIKEIKLKLAQYQVSHTWCPDCAPKAFRDAGLEPPKGEGHDSP
jgi:hypothetical protein